MVGVVGVVAVVGGVGAAVGVVASLTAPRQHEQTCTEAVAVGASAVLPLGCTSFRETGEPPNKTGDSLPV